jgi:hypothetical protein
MKFIGNRVGTASSMATDGGLFNMVHNVYLSVKGRWQSMIVSDIDNTFPAHLRSAEWENSENNQKYLVFWCEESWLSSRNLSGLTFTVIRAGWGNVTAIGGGGGGGAAYGGYEDDGDGSGGGGGGGGGAGGYVSGSFYFPAGTYTVSIGDGGKGLKFDGYSSTGVAYDFNYSRSDRDGGNTTITGPADFATITAYGGGCGASNIKEASKSDGTGNDDSPTPNANPDAPGGRHASPGGSGGGMSGTDQYNTYGSLGNFGTGTSGQGHDGGGIPEDVALQPINTSNSGNKVNNFHSMPVAGSGGGGAGGVGHLASSGRAYIDPGNSLLPDSEDLEFANQRLWGEAAPGVTESRDYYQLQQGGAGGAGRAWGVIEEDSFPPAAPAKLRSFGFPGPEPGKRYFAGGGGGGGTYFDPFVRETYFPEPQIWPLYQNGGDGGIGGGGVGGSYIPSPYPPTARTNPGAPVYLNKSDAEASFPNNPDLLDRYNGSSAWQWTGSGGGGAAPSYPQNPGVGSAAMRQGGNGANGLVIISFTYQ